MVGPGLLIGHIEGWRTVDALYITFVTGLTIGYEIRRTPVRWLLAFVAVALVAQHVKPETHAPLFVLSVRAVVPLAALLVHTAALKQESGTRLDPDQVESAR
jgi:hypothetical protein